FRKCHTHSPTTRHVLCLLVYGNLVEAKTCEDEGSPSREGRGVHLVHMLRTRLAIGCEETEEKNGVTKTYVVEIHQYGRLRPVLLEEFLGQLIQSLQLVLS